MVSELTTNGNTCVNDNFSDDTTKHQQKFNDDNNNNDNNNNNNGSNDYNIDKEIDSSEATLFTCKNANVSNYDFNVNIPIKFVGLKNLGNTCYINSTIQSLYGTNKLRQYLMKKLFINNNNNYHNDDDERIQLKLSKLFNQMNEYGSDLLNNSSNNNNNIQIIKPDKFINGFRLIKPQFIRNEQHDAQEFLTILLECLHQEDNKVKKNKNCDFEPKNADEAWQYQYNYIDNSFYSRLFVGQIESTLKCLSCNHKSFSWTNFWQLNLNLKNDITNNDYNHDSDDQQQQQTWSIDQCLQEYMAWETLIDTAFCENCKQNQVSKKRSIICRSPHYLIIHLKRFTHTGSKIDHKITINHSLELCGKKYSLYSCILHRGSESSGHYQTILTPYYRHWILFDDEQVFNNLSIEDVENLLGNNGYICFYRSVANKIVAINNSE